MTWNYPPTSPSPRGQGTGILIPQSISHCLGKGCPGEGGGIIVCPSGCPKHRQGWLLQPEGTFSSHSVDQEGRRSLLAMPLPLAFFLADTQTHSWRHSSPLRKRLRDNHTETRPGVLEPQTGVSRRLPPGYLLKWLLLSLLLLDGECSSSLEPGGGL